MNLTFTFSMKWPTIHYYWIFWGILYLTMYKKVWIIMTWMETTGKPGSQPTSLLVWCFSLASYNQTPRETITILCFYSAIYELMILLGNIDIDIRYFFPFPIPIFIPEYIPYSVPHIQKSVLKWHNKCIVSLSDEWQLWFSLYKKVWMRSQYPAFWALWEVFLVLLFMQVIQEIQIRQTTQGKHTLNAMSPSLLQWAIQHLYVTQSSVRSLIRAITHIPLSHRTPYRDSEQQGVLVGSTLWQSTNVKPIRP